MIAALAVPLLVITVSPSSGRSQAAALESFDGAWSFASGQSDLDSAIDRVADRMNLFIREIARSEIHRRIRAEQRIHFDVQDEERLSLQLDDWGPIQLSVGGGARRVRGPSGESLRVSARFRGGRLVERQVASRGQRLNVFALSPDGERLTMAVRVEAEQLPADIRYRLTYRRAR